MTGKAAWQWIKKSGAEERTANTERNKRDSHQRGYQRMEKEISQERKGNLNQKCSGGRKYLNTAEMSQEENKVVERKLINYGNEIQKS